MDAGPSTCPVCDKTFNKKKDLLRHIRKVHKIHVGARGKQKCPMCDVTPSDYISLRRHLQGTHNCKIQRSILNFPSMEAFMEWKNQMEQETNYRYVRSSGAKVYPVRNEKKMYYTCHRSGFYSTSGKGKRQIKKQGSNKINCTCPSTIDVVEYTSSGAVHVVFWKTHVGHSADLEYAQLTAEDRAFIAGKIYQGMTFEMIMEDIKQSINSDEMARIRYLTKRDYHNIKRMATKYYDSVQKSIEQWVLEMKELGNDSPILYYKATGDDDPEEFLQPKDIFLVIMTKLQQAMLKKIGGDRVCIDAGHGADGYGFEIITLLVMDTAGEGWPVAFCLTNQTEGRGLAYFFQKVREIGGDLPCQVFITIDSALYLSTWCAVMNMPQKCLLAAWHVDKLWRQKLTKIKGSPEKKNMLYGHLRALMLQPDHEKFETQMSKFLSDYTDDEEAHEFIADFESNFSSTYPMWAFCHRLKWDITANLFAERYHKAVEYIYTEGKKNQRLDSCLHALITLSRDKIFDHLMDTAKLKTSKVIKDINKAHNRGRRYDFGSIQSTETNTWEVKDKDRTVHVTRLDVRCSCVFRCSSCSVCVHMFSCSCADHLVKFNVCEHVHACLLKNHIMESSLSGIKDEDLDEGDDDDDEVAVIDPSQNVDPDPAKTENLKNIQKKLEVLSALSSSITTEDLNSLNKTLDTAIRDLKKSIPPKIPVVNPSAKQNFLQLMAKKPKVTSVQTLAASGPLVSLPPGIVLLVVPPPQQNQQ